VLRTFHAPLRAATGYFLGSLSRGFLPVLERTADGYQLREHNCPLMRLTADYPEVCDMVQRWLEALFGAHLDRVRCLRLGHPYSAYTIIAAPRPPRRRKNYRNNQKSRK
jgi:hypothetical protein